MYTLLSRQDGHPGGTDTLFPIPTNITGAKVLIMRVKVKRVEWYPEGFEAIPGYEGLYGINKQGHVYTCGYIRTTHNANNKGYPTLTLTKDTKQKFYTIHRMLARIFIPNPKGLPVINHKDGNKRNFKLNNLEWCTEAYNLQHAYDIGLRIFFPKKGCRSRRKLTYDQAIEIRKMYKDGIKQKELAKTYDVKRNVIFGITSRRSYNWR